MTPETAAQNLADALVTAEAALADVTAKTKVFTQAMSTNGMGPITRQTFTREAQGIEGAIGRFHLDLTPFDPRPQPLDGGGK